MNASATNDLGWRRRVIGLMVLTTLLLAAALLVFLVWVNVRPQIFQVVVCDGYLYTREDGVTVTPMPGDADDGCWTVPGGP